MATMSGDMADLGHGCSWRPRTQLASFRLFTQATIAVSTCCFFRASCRDPCGRCSAAHADVPSSIDMCRRPANDGRRRRRAAYNISER